MQETVHVWIPTLVPVEAREAIRLPAAGVNRPLGTTIEN